MPDMDRIHARYTKHDLLVDGITAAAFIGAVVFVLSLLGSL